MRSVKFLVRLVKLFTGIYVVRQCNSSTLLILVTALVFGYFKVDKRNNIIDAVDVDNPPVVINTRGMWLDVPRTALDILSSKRYNVAGSIHAAEHAILSLLPNVVITSPGDVRTECKAPHKEYAKVALHFVKSQLIGRVRRKENDLQGMHWFRPCQQILIMRLTFYDAVGRGGGAGISCKAFDFIDLLLQQAVERVDSCGCKDGCPECITILIYLLMFLGITSPVCSEGNVVTSKVGAAVILKSILNIAFDVESLPEGNERGISIETIVPVDSPVKEADEIMKF